MQICTGMLMQLYTIYLAKNMNKMHEAYHDLSNRYNDIYITMLKIQ